MITTRRYTAEDHHYAATRSAYLCESGQRTCTRHRAEEAETVAPVAPITADLIGEITANGGFTFDPTADKLITVGSVTGYAIAVPGTEHVIGTGSISREAFAAAVADLITEYAEAITVDGCVLGGWYSAERDVYMIELTKIWYHLDRATAITIGQSSHQEAIFDLATGEEIPTGGTGDGPPASPASVRTWIDDLAPADAPVTADDLAEATRTDDLDAIDDLLTGDPWRVVPVGTFADNGVDLAECTDDDHEHCPLHGCVEYVCCAPVETVARLPWDDAATTPASAWDAADAPARGWTAYLRANPIIGNLIF